MNDYLYGKELAEYYILNLTIINKELHGLNQSQWLRWLEFESEKLDLAIEWCLFHSEGIHLGLLLGEQLGQFWLRQGLLKKGIEKFRLILDRDEKQESSLSRALITLTLATMFQRAGNLDESSEYYNKSLIISNSLQDRLITAESLLGLGEIALQRSDFDSALLNLKKSLDFFKELKNQRGICKALKGIGIVKFRQNMNSEAILYIKESMESAKIINDEQFIADCLNDLGIAMSQDNFNYEEVDACYNEALKIIHKLKDREREAIIWTNRSYLASREMPKLGLKYAQNACLIFREIGSPQKIAYSLINTASNKVTLGDYTSAYQDLKESLSLLVPLENFYGIAIAFEDLSRLLSKKGMVRQAAKIYSMAINLRESKGITITDDILLDHKIFRDDIYEKLGSEVFNKMWDDGKSMTLENAFLYAVSFVDI